MGRTMLEAISTLLREMNSDTTCHLFFFGGLPQERVWVISIARLRTSLPLYLRPINVLVLNDPYMEILS